MTAENDYVSVNALACELQWPANSLRAAAATLDISPSLKLNRIEYFTRTQAEALATHLHQHGRGKQRMVATDAAGSERLVADNSAHTSLVAKD